MGTEVKPMKLLEKLMSRRFAQPAVQLVKWFCYLVIFFYVFCLVLSCLGRQSFQLYTSTGVQENAIYAGADYDASHSLTVSMDDPVYVHGNAQGQVDLVTQIALSLMFAVKAVPAIIAYWLLVRVLGNIQGGKIFTEQNAVYLLGFGLLQGAVALVAPFLRMLLCSLANLLAESQVSISTGSGMLNQLMLSLAFVVAASIMHYGIRLQDEVDHTL